MPTVYTMEDIKEGFERLDKNEDGYLSFGELRDILLRGNPDFTEKQLRTLWRGVDKDRDGNVEFDEFVDYIHGKPFRKAKEIWQDTFYAYSGSDDRLAIDEFLRLCSDSGLCDEHFGDEDAEAVFKKVKKPDNLVGPKGFSKAMARIAKRKGVTKAAIQKAVLTCAGPASNWEGY